MCCIPGEGGGSSSRGSGGWWRSGRVILGGLRRGLGWCL